MMVKAMIFALAIVPMLAQCDESDVPVESSTTAPVKYIEVGWATQYFIDDFFFDTSQNVRLKIHPARKTGERSIERDRSWESAALNSFTVMNDNGRVKATGAKYRMWYECQDGGGRSSPGSTFFCYAESADGIDWTKPDLGLFEYEGSTANNILLEMIGPGGAHSRASGTGVFVDRSAVPEEKYKAVSQAVFTVADTRQYRIAGMYSADGLRWTRYPRPICDVSAEDQYWVHLNYGTNNLDSAKFSRCRTRNPLKPPYVVSGLGWGPCFRGAFS